MRLKLFWKKLEKYSWKNIVKNVQKHDKNEKNLSSDLVNKTHLVVLCCRKYLKTAYGVVVLFLKILAHCSKLRKEISHKIPMSRKSQANLIDGFILDR